MGGGRGGGRDAGQRRKFRKIWVGLGGNEAVRLGFEGRFVPEEGGLPGEELVVDFPGGAGDLGQLRAVGDEGGLDAEFLGDAVAVGLDAVLEFDFGLGE